MKSLLLPVALFVAGICFGQAPKVYTPDLVPNTKLINNSYVSDPDGILDAPTVADINSRLASLEATNSVQVAIVTLRSIGDVSEVDFAQELFNLWGIGQRNNNGLLILLVTDKPVIRFHTGYGLEGPLPDITCKRIQRTSMVPYFKEGDYNTGMLEGVKEVIKVVSDPVYANEVFFGTNEPKYLDYFDALIFVCVALLPLFLIVWAVKARRFSNSKNPAKTDYPQMRLKRNVWLIEFGAIPALIVGGFAFSNSPDAGSHLLITLYLYLMATIVHRVWREQKMIAGLVGKGKYFQVTQYLKNSQWYWIVMALIFPLPILLYVPFHYVRKRYYRNHPRKCSLCQGEMLKLNEVADDQYLTKGEKMEEQVKSVDYDIWQCQACKATEKWNFVRVFSSYDYCPSCRAKTYFLVSDRTIKSATYSSTGTGEKLYQCASCGISKRSTYTIAQLTSSSSGSSGGRSGSSSSGGGSWGGGRSGGGGASSSW